MQGFNTPILFLVFNRPEETRKVFETIRKAKPRLLFISADGPRTEVENEQNICEIVRHIATDIDWLCDIKTLFRSENLGCGKAVSEGITWFFQNVERGIILEDDCLCDESFFLFAAHLLDMYKDNRKVMHIGAHGPLKKFSSNTHYSFTKYPLVWGWATWKRAWDLYDYNITDWPTKGKEILESHFQGKEVLQGYWNGTFDEVFKKGIDTWDYQWAFACLVYNGLSVFPHRNLVCNIGFGDNATHTIDHYNPRSNMVPGEIEFPLDHPVLIGENLYVNKQIEKDIFNISTKSAQQFNHLFLRIKSKIRLLMSKVLFA